MENVALMRLTGHSTPFRMTPEAHRELVTYLSDARAALVRDPDGDESVRDVEVAIGEHLQALGDGGIADDDLMRAILDRTGPVVPVRHEGASPDSGVRQGGWRRIVKGKWLTGVCLGVATRSGLSPVWVRSLYVAISFVVGSLLAPLAGGYVMLGWFGFSVLVYLALSLLLPPVDSVEAYHRQSQA